MIPHAVIRRSFTRRGARIWKPEAERLLGTAPDEDIARQTGHSLSAVRSRRHQLGIFKADSKVRRWTAQEEKLLGTMLDQVIAARLGRSVKSIHHRRLKLNIRWFS